MIEYFLAENEEEVYRCDLCIVGTGPAAISLALRFIEKGGPKKRVIFIESQPSLEDDAFAPCDAQFLNRAEVTGWLETEKPIPYPLKTRSRRFGGTSTMWSGDFVWSFPLDASDFEERRVRKGFKWPFSYEDMKPAYHIAQKIFWLPEYEYDNAQYWTKKFKHLATLGLEGGDLRTRVIQFSEMRPFQERYSDFLKSPQVRVICNATLTELELKTTAGGDKQVCRAVARRLNDHCTAAGCLYVEADHFAIAAGSLESTRILLLQDLGNHSQQLGKNFIEHFRIWAAGSYTHGRVTEEQKSFYFSPNKPELKTAEGHNAAIFATLVPTLDFMDKEEIGNFRILLGGYQSLWGKVGIDWEQLPNLQSRITLSDQTDVFGQRRAKLDLRYSEADKKTVRKALAVTRDLLSKKGYAKDFSLPDLDARDPFLEWKTWEGKPLIHPDHHPMGSTRMSTSPGDGVVDENCKVHGTANLYVASSSVFPTGGYANPTLTVIALAVRLADHIIA